MKDTSQNPGTRSKIQTKIRALFPSLDERNNFQKPDWKADYSNYSVSFRTNPPRPDMGRFDAGKKFWTIDLSENATYSRTKQVRITLDGTEPKFDESKVKEHFDALCQIVDSFVEQNRIKKENRQQLPNDLPFAVNATVDGSYNVVFQSNGLGAERVVELAELINNWNKK